MHICTKCKFHCRIDKSDWCKNGIDTNIYIYKTDLVSGKRYEYVNWNELKLCNILRDKNKTCDKYKKNWWFKIFLKKLF